ncbi:MAG: MoaD/ThiS family protein [Thaumarchaeota archaeon]|nr:MoaD/ThiS family protein [Nitrososphaerota archaeon]
MDKATIRIMGNLARLGNGERLDSVLVCTPITVGKLLTLLHDKHGVDLRRDSTLVLVDGVEANALEDLDTKIESGSEVVLVPMFHGG